MRITTYHKYTDEDLKYIKEHCYDKAKDVAAVIGASKGTVSEYMRRFREGIFERKTSYKPQKYYALYRRSTDELVCSGTAVECAEQLGISKKLFHIRVHKALSGKIQKWDVYVEPYEEDE